MALVALLLMVLAAPAVGWVCGSLTDDALQESVRVQQARCHATTAVVVRRVSGAGPLLAGPEVSSERTTHTSVVARWKAPDGTVRRGTVTTSSRRTNPGAEVKIWTDLDGRPRLRPMDASTSQSLSGDL